MWLRLVLALVLLVPGPGRAHPHIFVDVSFDLRFDTQGRLAEVRTFWLYDPFYSLMIVEERAADADGDGELSPAEMQPLQGFDAEWGAGSEGDLHLTQAGRKLTLGPGTDWSAIWQEGRLGSFHSRKLEPPVEMTQGAVYLQPYDPTYYFAYAVAADPTFQGRTTCRTRLFLPDLTAAQRKLQEKLAAFSSNAEAEAAGYPDVGADFTQTIWLACW